MTRHEVLIGDCRNVLPTLEAGSVHTCVTSPPYWGLRDYGTGSWEGGDASCSHQGTNARRDHSHHATMETRGAQPYSAASATPMRSACTRCGAVRVDAQIGLEETVADFIEQLVLVFRAVRRVLRDDGTLWLNLGDTYSSAGGPRDNKGLNEGTKRAALYEAGHRPPRKHLPLKRKDKLLLPHRVAIALQDDGWYVRQDNVWEKPNALPEVARDRPATSHEYVFLLSKSEHYFYDHDAVREPVTGGAHSRGSGLNPKALAVKPGRARIKANGSFSSAVRRIAEDGLRTMRSVWSIPTRPFAGAHFATFPPDLARRCIIAGSPKGGRVLDPFAGSGTVAATALEEERDSVSVELNPDYADLLRARLASTQPPLPLTGAS